MDNKECVRLFVQLKIWERFDFSVEDPVSVTLAARHTLEMELNSLFWVSQNSYTFTALHCNKYERVKMCI